MAKPWRPAKSLIQLRIQINAAHPNRSKVSDGLLGDKRHQALGSKSQHNPDANGVVRALDITHDPAHGVDGKILSRQLTIDPRTLYVIFAGEIWKARTGEWEDYRGDNRHDHHVHISVVADPHKYDDVSPWKLGDVPVVRRVLRFGDEGPDVAELQRKLGIKADGKFGKHTLFALREFQEFHNLIVDGIAGPKTYALLFPER